MRDRSTKMLAVLMVSLMAVVALAPLAGEETDAETTVNSFFGAGTNNKGQLGNNTTTDSSVPVQIGEGLGSIVDAIMVTHMTSSNASTTYMLTSDGRLFGCGYNGSGQFGNNTTTDSSVPVQIGADLGVIVKMWASQANLFFKTQDGKVYGCGYNGYGNLATNTTGAAYTPTLAWDGYDVAEIYLTYETTYMQTSDGRLFGCGYNSRGQLGNNTTTDSSVPVQIGASLGTIKKVVFVNETLLFLTNSGEAYGCGYNGSGQINPSDLTNQKTPTQIGASLGTIIDIAACPQFTYVLTSENKLYGQGSKTNGLAGDGTSGSSAGSTSSITQIGESLGSISKVVASLNNDVIIITSGKEAYGLGYNNHGELGVGTISITSTPTRIGSTIGDIENAYFGNGPAYANTALQTSTNQVYVCGYNNKGQLGISNTTANIITPTQVGASYNIVKPIMGGATNGFITTETFYDVSIASNNSDYGSLSAAAASVPAGTTVATSSNTITLGTSPDATVITATPTASDAQYTYAFDSWTGVPAGGTVTEDLTITANFTRTVNEYTITWIIGEDTDTTTVAYGELPTYPDPTPPEGYYFAGWDPEIVPVTGAATYTALFSNMVVTLDPGKGTLSGPTTIEVVQGQPIGDLPTPTPKAGYTFTGWFDSEGNEVTSETIVTETESFTLYAQYELDEALKPVKAMTDLLPLIFVVGIIILMIGTAFYYYRP